MSFNMLRHVSTCHGVHGMQLYHVSHRCAGALARIVSSDCQRRHPDGRVTSSLPADRVLALAVSPTSGVSSNHAISNHRSNNADSIKLHKLYLQLAKSRLTALVMVSAGAGYVLAPGAFSFGTLCLVASGTMLTSAAANTVNQWMEVKHDALMVRTASRPLVTGKLSSAHAMTFAGVCAVSGASLLYLTQPLAAVLGIGNVLLYTLVYTPLKRVSIVNTWVGAVVGAVPPLIGWSAATGQLGLTAAVGGWCLAALLYGWQFPHFNALSWNLRRDYARAGYRMMAVTHPDLCRRVALRYSMFLAALPLVTSLFDVTSWLYVVTTLPVHAYLLRLSWRFYWDADSSSARQLTRFSYVQLSCCLLLLLLTANSWQSPAAADSWQLGQQLCVAQPFINAGWNFTPLTASAERQRLAELAVSDQLTAVSSQLAVGDQHSGAICARTCDSTT